MKPGLDGSAFYLPSCRWLRHLSASNSASATLIGMARPLRLEFPHALYHVTARGNRHKPIYHDDADRRLWMEVLARVCERHNFVIHGFCQMGNHYHLLIETVEANLAQGMRQLNGLYSQQFNRRHELVGHLFQGRYHAILVQKESHLLELSRYIVLNPVRAAMVSSPDEWQWSSHHFLIGAQASPTWFECDWLLSQFGDTHAAAISAYRTFVLAGLGKTSPLTAVRHRILLGDDEFIAAHQRLQLAEAFLEAPKTERRAVALSLADYRIKYANRDEAMARAYQSTAFTMTQIAHGFGVSTKTVSRAVAAFEKQELPGQKAPHTSSGSGPSIRLN